MCFFNRAAARVGDSGRSGDPARSGNPGSSGDPAGSGLMGSGRVFFTTEAAFGAFPVFAGRLVGVLFTSVADLAGGLVGGLAGGFAGGPAG